jgi:hypothetical protein
MKQNGPSGRQGPAAQLRRLLPDFAIVQSYLSTATKWGIGKLDALRDLFNGHAWIPPASNPPDNPALPSMSQQAAEAC